jgi:hypothetical protein
VTALAALAASAACSDREQSEPPVDTTLARDLAIAMEEAPPFTPGDTAISTTAPSSPAPAASPEPAPPAPVPKRPRPAPSVGRTAARAPAPAPRRTRRAPAPRVATDAPAPAPTAEPAPGPAPAPRSNVGSLAAGTSVGLATEQRVCTATNRVGDKLTAIVSGTVVGTNGLTIPDGAKAVLEVASITRGQRPEDTRITFRVRAVYAGERALSLPGEAAAGDQLEKTRVAGKGSDAKKVIGGAIAGAILGQVIGKDARGTVIGAAAGAAAGTAAAKATTSYEGCLPAGTALRLTLAEGVEVPLQ